MNQRKPAAADLAAMLKDIETTAARRVEEAARRRNVPALPVETRAERLAAEEETAETAAEPGAEAAAEPGAATGPEAPDGAGRAAEPEPPRPPRARPEPVRAESARPVDPELVALLDGAGVPKAHAALCGAFLGAAAAGRLREDPWELLAVPGVRVEQADHFARRLLGDAAGPQDPRRARALVASVLAAAARQGHTVVPVETVLERLGRAAIADPAAAVADAVEEALAVALADGPAADEAEGGGEGGGEGGEEGADEAPTLLALPRYAMAEEAVAEGLRRLAATADDNGVTVLSGPAADLTALALAERAAEAGRTVVVAAPTARRAAELTARHGAEAVTVQRLLAAVTVADGVGYLRGELSPVEAEVVVVVDAGALDVEVAAALLEACQDGTRLILAGDAAELASAGPGRLLADLVTAGVFPVARTQTAGPDSETPVEQLAGAVREGELAAVEAPGREVVVVPAQTAAEAAHRAVQLVCDSIPRAIGVPVEHVQVVTAAAGGEAGSTALNRALKARLNPGEGKFGGFDPGDRVQVAVPLEGAPAGETGVVAGAGPDGLEVELPGGTVTVHPSQVWRLRHGWACTVQQAVGARWPAVVAVFPPAGAAALSRALVLTAAGRAVRHLSIVQAAGAELARAVAEVPGAPRGTRLAALLREP